MMPKASWLVPVYNGGVYLEAALRSIKGQSFRDFEAIIVDDGSTDNSEAIIRSFCQIDARFQYYHKANSGIVDALNFGLARCRGDYIVRMDADDICEPHRLAVQVAFMDQHPNCVVSGSRNIVIDETGSVVRYSTASQRKSEGPAGFPPRTATLLHPTMIARSAAFAKVGGYRNGFLAAEDYDLLLRLRHHGEIVELTDYLLRYRIHSKSESATKIRQQRFSCMKAEIVDFATSNCAGEECLKTLCRIETLDELCEAAQGLGKAMPTRNALHIYYSAEFLRRATYRLPPAEALDQALRTSRQALLILPSIYRGSERYFLIKALKELARWLVVTAIGRNKSKSEGKPDPSTA